MYFLTGKVPSRPEDIPVRALSVLRKHGTFPHDAVQAHCQPAHTEDCSEETWEEASQAEQKGKRWGG